MTFRTQRHYACHSMPCFLMAVSTALDWLSVFVTSLLNAYTINAHTSSLPNIKDDLLKLRGLSWMIAPTKSHGMDTGLENVYTWTQRPFLRVILVLQCCITKAKLISCCQDVFKHTGSITVNLTNIYCDHCSQGQMHVAENASGLRWRH